MSRNSAFAWLHTRGEGLRRVCLRYDVDVARGRLQRGVARGEGRRWHRGGGLSRIGYALPQRWGMQCGEFVVQESGGGMVRVYSHEDMVACFTARMFCNRAAVAAVRSAVTIAARWRVVFRVRIRAYSTGRDRQRSGLCHHACRTLGKRNCCSN